MSYCTLVLEQYMDHTFGVAGPMPGGVFLFYQWPLATVITAILMRRIDVTGPLSVLLGLRSYL